MIREPLVRAEGLTREFTGGRWPDRARSRVGAVRDVTLDIFAGETLGLVGHSGCGKSTLGRLLVRLITPTAGRVCFDGRDLAQVARREMQTLRHRMQIIFQAPSTSLNPRMTVRQIITEPLVVSGTGDRRERERRMRRLLERVALRGEFADRYPDQLSGGQRQRVAIARALACRPSFIVADEPLSALDSLTQARILDLLVSLQAAEEIAYLFIAHDMSAVRSVSDRVAVMYHGQIVELGPTTEVLSHPLHPYTRILLDCTLVLRVTGARTSPARCAGPPVRAEDTAGCPFASLCDVADSSCLDEMPRLREVSGGHFVRCLKAAQ